MDSGTGAVTLLMIIVPTMDRQTRQTRHSRLPLRGGQAGQQENEGVHVVDLEIPGQRTFSLEDASALRPIRESHEICYATLLCCTNEAEPRDPGRPIE